MGIIHVRLDHEGMPAIPIRYACSNLNSFHGCRFDKGYSARVRMYALLRAVASPFAACLNAIATSQL